MLKSKFFSKFFNLHKNNVGNISAHKARVLQKGYVKDFNKNNQELISPPYMQIASQLDPNKPEIFRAAVYYLVCIAENKSEQAPEIIDILKNVQEKKLSPDDLLYVKSQIKILESMLP